MISYDQALKKIEAKDFLFTDAQGDNLLHSLIKQEEKATIDIRPVQILLKHHPELANIPDKKGLFPVQLLDQAQVKARQKRQNFCFSEEDELNPPPPSNRLLRRLLLKYTSDEIHKKNLEKSAHITFLELLENDSERTSRFVPESEVKQILNSPCVLIFTGIESFAKPLVESMTRKIKKTLGIYKVPLPHLKILSARYPGNNQDICNDYRLYHQVLTPQQWPDEPKGYIQPFVQRYMRPLYLDEKGKKYSVEQAMKNMRRINLVGYCYGVYIIQEMADLMAQDMQKNGYLPEQIKKIQSQILNFNIASDLTKGRYQTNLSSYHLINTHDEVVGQHVQDIFQDLPIQGKDDLLTTLPNQPNQPLLFINTLENNTAERTHSLETYCNPANASQKKALTWMKAILFNGINNSFENEKSSKFLPLPKDLQKTPEHLLWLKQIPIQFHVSHKKKKEISVALLKKRRIRFVKN